jgi:Tol biopolymer transport system component
VIGETLGPYSVLGLLGAGGMGEVYRARDTRLGRQVALKVLPDAYAHDPERLSRFRREAQALAALNHPNIAQIYGLEETGERHALVLELVEGPTLHEAIAAARPAGLGVGRSLEIARQIVEALDAAHAQGIVHRDLKPANIKVQSNPDDQSVVVKVLDFGLAKALSMDDSTVASDLAHSPTITSPRARQGFGEAGTELGVILGTAGYMSPEQAMGAVADRRADIWAFGVILYEMLGGRLPFQGTDVGTLLTESLTSDVDLRALPADTPPSVRRLIRRCLEKNPRRRLRDVGDARAELDDRDGGDATIAVSPAPPAIARARTRTLLPWSLVALLGAALAVATLRPVAPAPDQSPPVRFLLNGPDGAPFRGEFALSPDGRRVAFMATIKGRSSAWVRTLDTLEVTELPFTENAQGLFWSPDSRSLGHISEGEIRTINVDSGLRGVACRASADREAAWGAGDLIVHGGPSGIQACGRDTPVTALADGEIAHRAPWFLPDGRHFLYLARTPTTAELRIASVDPGSPTVVVGPSDSNAVYSQNHILFVRGNVLLAQPFDASTRTARGEPFRVTEDPIGITLVAARALISASNAGTIGFSAQDARPSTLTWFDRKGTARGTIGSSELSYNLALSPDGQRLAMSRRNRSTMTFNSDIWVLDLARGGQSQRITDHPAAEFDPIWSRDGRTLVFNSNRTGPFALYRRPADGSGIDELIASHDVGLTTPDWSPVADVLLYTVDSDGGRPDIWMLPIGSGEKPSPFLATASSEHQPAFSPDGRWVAYTSNVSGRNEVYVRAFTGETRQFAVSLDGGSAPRWRGDGREIFFLAPDGSMMTASVETTGMRAGTPVRLFGTQIILSNGHPYVVTSDGQRFLFGVPDGATTGSGISIVTNWLAAVRR